MKRRSLAHSYLIASGVAVCAVSSPGLLSSQTISLIGGANQTVLANVDLNPERYDGFHPSYGANLGMGVSFRLSPPEANESLWAQLSAVYAHKGAVMLPGGVDDKDEGLDFRLDYMDLALLADMRFTSIIDGIFIHFLIGPSLGVLLSCDVAEPRGDDEPPQVTRCLGDVREDRSPWGFRRLDAGVVGGAGLEVALTERVELHASAQRTFGLGYVDTEYDTGTVDGPVLVPALKNRSLSLRAALAVPLR